MGNEKRAIDAKEFCKRCGFSMAKFYREQQLGNIPKPMKLGYRMSRWLESDVDDYLAKMAKQRNDVRKESTLVNASSIKPKPQKAVHVYKHTVNYNGWKIDDKPYITDKSHHFVAVKYGIVITDSVSFDHLIERLDEYKD